MYEKATWQNSKRVFSDLEDNKYKNSNRKTLLETKTVSMKYQQTSGISMKTKKHEDKVPIIRSNRKANDVQHNEKNFTKLS